MSFNDGLSERKKQDGATSKVRILIAWADLDGTKEHPEALLERTLPVIDRLTFEL